MEGQRQFDDWKIVREPIVEEKEGINSAFTFLCVVVLLSGLGLTMLYSASYDEALSHGLPHYYYLVRQLLFAVAALAVGVIIRFVPVSWFSHAAYPVTFVSVVLMAMTFVSPFGSTALGARRWLRIGPLSMQPVELVKFAMVFFLAKWFSKEQKNKFVRYAIPFVMMAFFSALIILQRDFSSTIVFIGLCLAMFIAGGIGISYLLLIIAFVAVPGVIVMLSAPYRVRRIASFLMPQLDTSSINYQVGNAMKAIKAGGVFGVGLGKGTYKLGLLPEVQNDFIFANMCEELGLIWVLFILALFAFFAILGYKTYQRMQEQDAFFSYLAFGLTTMIVWQAIINIAVVIGLLPPTGIPLPFFSQGGTNLFIILVSSSILYRIMLVASGRIPLEKSSLSPQERKMVDFPSLSEEHTS